LDNENVLIEGDEKVKAVVLYKSKTGFVKKYAQWIAEELHADIFEASEITVDRLADYDTIIYGGGLYAVGINGVKLITQNTDKLEGKKIVVFASGATPSRQDDIKQVRDKNFTLEQQKNIKFFYLRGGFDNSKLQFVDRILMMLLKWKLKSKKKLTPDEKGMLAAYNQPVDFTRKKYIEELISYVNSST
jgi:menaquinone-dependent protoporphyrinogen IX oxidase